MITFDKWARSMPGKAVALSNQATGYRPAYLDEMRTLGKVGMTGGLALSASVPVVMNNPQYIDDFRGFADTMKDYGRAMGYTSNVLNAGEFLRSSDPMSYMFRPGTMANVASRPYIDYSLGTNDYNMPYVGLGRLANSITRNQANPYGAIPGISHLEMGIDKVTRGLNQSKVGQFFGQVGKDVYDQSIGRLYGLDTGLFRGAGRLAQIPGDIIDGVGGSVGNLFREGYQYLDNKVFDGVLPGGAMRGDVDKMTPEQLAGYNESNEYNDPFSGIKDIFSGIGDSFRSKATIQYEDKFNDLERTLSDRFVDKGFSRKQANAIVTAPEYNYVLEGMDTGTKYADGQRFMNDLQASRLFETGFTDAQEKELTKYIASLNNTNMDKVKRYNDAGIIPYIENMQGADIEFTDDYAMEVTLKEYENRAQQYADLHVDLDNKFGSGTGADLLGDNALSENVLNLINSDIDPDMSVFEAEKYSKIMDTGYSPVSIDLSEQEKYRIAGQYDFNQKEYNDHIKYLDNAEMKDVSSRINQISAKGKNMSADELTELEGLVAKQNGYKDQVTDSTIKNDINASNSKASSSISAYNAEQTRIQEQNEAKVREELASNNLTDAQINTAMQNYDPTSHYQNFLRDFDYSYYTTPTHNYNYNYSNYNYDYNNDYSWDSMTSSNQQLNYLDNFDFEINF